MIPTSKSGLRNESHGGRRPVESPALTGDAFIEAWVRLSELGTPAKRAASMARLRKPVGGDQLVDWGVLVQPGNLPPPAARYRGPATPSSRDRVHRWVRRRRFHSKWPAVSALRIDDLDWHRCGVVDLLQRVVRFPDGVVEIVPMGDRNSPPVVRCRSAASTQRPFSRRCATCWMRCASARHRRRPEPSPTPTPTPRDLEADSVPTTTSRSTSATSMETARSAARIWGLC